MIPRCWVNTSHTTFSIAGPTAWNSLPDERRDPAWRVIVIALNGFLRQSCLVSASVISALEVSCNGMCYINSHFTYSLPSHIAHGQETRCHHWANVNSAYHCQHVLSDGLLPDIRTKCQRYTRGPCSRTACRRMLPRVTGTFALKHFRFRERKWNFRSQEQKCCGSFALNETQNWTIYSNGHNVYAVTFTQTHPFELKSEECARGAV